MIFSIASVSPSLFSSSCIAVDSSLELRFSAAGNAMAVIVNLSDEVSALNFCATIFLV